MRDIAEGLFSWVFGLMAIAMATVIANANPLMTLGGLILLGLRIYVDGAKAYRVYKEGKEHNDYGSSERD